MASKERERECQVCIHAFRTNKVYHFTNEGAINIRTTVCMPIKRALKKIEEGAEENSGIVT